MEKEIKKIVKLDAQAVAPPSKAHTLRAIIAASLAEGRSEIKNPLLAQDQLGVIAAMRQIGAKITENKGKLEITGTSAINANRIDVGSSGFLARMMIAIAATTDKKITIDGSEQLRRRPMNELCKALAKSGAKITFLNEAGKLPIVVEGPINGSSTCLDGSESSQFLSALLFAAPMTKNGMEIEVTDLVSAPYVDITAEILGKFGIKVEKKGSIWKIGNQKPTPTNISIEGDYSAAAFFMEAAAITGGRVEIRGLAQNSKQGDKAAIELFEKMGCEVTRKGDSIEIIGPSELKSVDLGMNTTPDLVPPIAVAAAFANGRSILRNIAHLRVKESDRLAALVENLSKIGIKSQIMGDDLHIWGSREKAHPAVIDPKNDHRIAMAFAIAGLKTGMGIENPDCVKKSFPDFWEELRKIG